MEWLDAIESLFKKAVECVCDSEVGVIFSSGVDSALVAFAASDYADVTAYTVGVEGSKDVEYARRVEETAPFKIKYIDLSEDDVESLIPTIISISGSRSPIDVGVGIPFFCASKAASSDGFKALSCGQGGDELFGGYWRYLECMVSDGPDAVAAWMEKDWANAYKDNLDRDIAMNKSNRVELRFPYLNREFSDYVRKMPIDLKIREGADILCDEVGGRMFARKYALKKLALKMGVPEYLVNRLKKAAQYGSGTNKTLDKIARKNGYPLKAREVGRGDYLKMFLEELKT